MSLPTRTLCLIALLVTACGGGGRGTAGNQPSGPAVLRSIDFTPANVSLRVGTMLELKATGHYSDGTSHTMSPETWNSSQKTVASVDELGVVSGFTAGTVTITGTRDNISGTIKVTVLPGNASVEYLYSFGGFDNPSDAGQPNGPLLQASDGNFYGTTRGGGTNTCSIYACGAIFKITPTGSETVLHSFGASASDGHFPTSSLMQAADGTLYGTTARGGDYDSGTVFKITPDGTYSVLYSFGGTPADGTVPIGALIQGSDGNLYGTTSTGGTNFCPQPPVAANNCGTFFKLTPGGVETVLYSFGATATDGFEPGAALLQASDGNFYGTTSVGGTYNGGTVFKLTPSGTETVLYSFGAAPVLGSAPQGVAPQGPLIEDQSGNFLGTTVAGGKLGCDTGCGTVFRITPDGSLSTLYSFAGASTGDGYGPAPFLIQGNDGNFYGTTISGGAFGGDLVGTAFRLTPEGTETVLYSFGPLNQNPSDPGAGLIQANDGAFYGAAFYSYFDEGAGTVFKLVTTP